MASEALEACGGAGHVEDTGLPLLLRDAQVLPIWEGTTNVLSLDVLRAAANLDVLGLVQRECESQLRDVSDASLARPAKSCGARCVRPPTGLARSRRSRRRLSRARDLALTLGRTLSLSL